MDDCDGVLYSICSADTLYLTSLWYSKNMRISSISGDENCLEDSKNELSSTTDIAAAAEIPLPEADNSELNRL